MGCRTVWVLLVAGLSGCAAGGHPGARERGEGPAAAEVRTMRIELLGFEGCPTTPAMRRNLAAALREIDPGLRFEEIDQSRLLATDARRGYPAPTVLVDGHDLFGLPVPTDAAMGCRIYPGGVPSAADLASRLRAGLRERGQ